MELGSTTYGNATRCRSGIRENSNASLAIKAILKVPQKVPSMILAGISAENETLLG